MVGDPVFLDYYEARLLYSLLYGMNCEDAMKTISKEKKAELGNKLCDCWRKQEG